MYLSLLLVKVNVAKQRQLKVDGVKDIRLNVVFADIEIVTFDSEDMVISLTRKENKCIQNK